MPHLAKKLISYLFPVPVTNIKGEVNPYLEVRLEKGKYVLNSASVNYSFGGSQRIFKNAFDHYDFSSRNVEKVLILGFGVGSVASILRKKKNVKSPIVGIEQDKMVISLMKEYFRPKLLYPLELLHEDAFDFVMNTNEHYNIIIVDVSIEDNIPDKFMRKEFIEALDNILCEGGIIFYNKIVNTLKHKNEAKKLKKLCIHVFGEIQVKKVWVKGGENWMLVHDRFHYNSNPSVLRKYKTISSNIFSTQTLPDLSI